MADFRKWLFAFALVALLLGAGTANAQSAFTCIANAGTPVIVRVEGITELVGDLLLQCTGGNPTPAGVAVPVSNVQLTLNTNITSRLIGSGYIDALLLLDEPYPTTTNPGINPAPVTIPPLSPAQVVCKSNLTPLPGNCNYLKGTYDGVNSTAYGHPNDPYLQASASTIFVGQQAAANIVTWLGVPIDAPGTTGVHVIRITNVRANACQLGLSSTLIPTQIVGFVQITGAPFITINNPQQTLAYIQQGLVAGGGNQTVNQCTNLNVSDSNGVGGNFSGGSKTGTPVTNVSIREGFAQSFKRRQYTNDATITDSATGGGATFNAAPQNVPGYAYNTESAFMPSQDGTSPAPGNTNNLGKADEGTRFLIRFNNIPTGANLELPYVVALTTNNGGCSSSSVNSDAGQPTPPSAVPDGGACGTPNWTGGFLQLVGTSDLSGNTGTVVNGLSSANKFNNDPLGLFGSGGFKGPGASGDFANAAQVTVTANTAAVVYVVVNSDPSAVETANIPIGVSFTSNTANNLPTSGQATASVSFAPLSTVNTASSGDSIPRFCDRSTPQNTFQVSVCVCNLLFPFITQAPGFDTGIAIANTTTDPYGTTPQTGPVTLWFYGQVTGGGALPTAIQKQTTTGSVPSGQVMTYTMFGGAGAFAAGLQPTPGFTGYMIAQASFQFCHGFAFISDLGAQKLAEGYLAIEIDNEQLNRTGVFGESKAH